MILDRIVGFIAKRCLYVVVLLSLAVYGYIQRNAPRHPDPASGHVVPVTVPGGRRTVRHIMYLNNSERILYHGSFIVGIVGALGILGHAAMNRTRKRVYD
jgi:hypothetical protein